MRKSAFRVRALLLCGAATLMPSSLRAEDTAARKVEEQAPNQAEIVVTAQRRAQNTQEIPYNITAVSGKSLENSGSTTLNDLTHNVAGLTTVDSGPAARGNNNDLTLRGIRTESPAAGSVPNQSVSSVSTYFGETPVFFPIVFKDIDHVEVLRGPQGTLYGSGAEAGTIRVIPNRPSFSKLSGELNLKGSLTDHSSHGNGAADGVLNVPITDTLAVRIVGGYEHLGGFINAVDRFETGAGGTPVPSTAGDLSSGPKIGAVVKDTNTSNQWFGRSALRWKPSDRIDLEISYLHQKTKVDDIQASNPDYVGGTEDLSTGAYPNATYTTRSGGKYDSTDPIAEPYKNSIDLVNATGTIDLGFATFTNATSYSDSKTYDVQDGTTAFVKGAANYLPYYASYPRFVSVGAAKIGDKSFVEEARLVSKWDKPINYVVGAYYQHQTDTMRFTQTAHGIDAFSDSVAFPYYNPVPDDLLYQVDRKFRFSDRAVFGELTWSITPRWQVTGGVRFFWQKFENTATQILPYCGAVCGDGTSANQEIGSSITSASSTTHRHIVKFNTSYDVTTGLKLYATYAEGFRHGGANALSTSGLYASLPNMLVYAPDLAKNYEVGIKGDMVDHRVKFSVAAFIIDLHNFQFDGSTPSGLAAVFNGTKARSKGIESEIQLAITRRLSAQFAYSYTDARAVQSVQILDLPPYAILDPSYPDVAPVAGATISKGARLPAVPKHSATASVAYAIPLTGGSAITVNGSISYRSSSPFTIDIADYQYFKLPSAFFANARLTYDYDRRWSADIFADNITNETGYSSGSGNETYQNPYQRRVVSRPRTVGIDLRYHF